MLKLAVAGIAALVVAIFAVQEVIPDRIQYHGIRTVTGYVVSTSRVADGDMHINLLPDPPYQKLLRRSNPHGLLIVEDVCRFKNETNCGRLSKFRLFPVAAGFCYRIKGRYAFDHSHHMWAELHGILAINMIDCETASGA